MPIILNMEPYNIKVGENIKKYRKGKMTQRELAEKIGKTESSIRKYEKGLVTIPVDVLERIAIALEISVIDLMGISPEDGVKQIEGLKKYLNEKLPRLAADEIPHMAQLAVTGFENLSEEVDFIRGILGKTNISDEFIKFTMDSTFESLGKMMQETEEGKKLLIDYHDLNAEGRAEAAKRVNELTYIPKYNRKAEQEE